MITDIKPVGMSILVSLLSAKEILGTKLHLPNVEQTDFPQAKILSFGKKFEPVAKEYGIDVGDRVVIAGDYMPLPKCDAYAGELALVDWSAIKAVLITD